LELLALPPGAAPADVIVAHRRRVAGRTDLVTFDLDGLETYLLEAAQRFFDWRVARGLLAPLSPTQVRRLGG